jgi:hypothetical protein
VAARTTTGDRPAAESCAAYARSSTAHQSSPLQFPAWA